MTIRNHHNASPPAGQGTTPSSGATAAASTLQIVDAINRPVSATGSLPAGYKTYSESATAAGSTSGFQIAYPSNWGVTSISAARTHFQDRQNKLIYMGVDLTPHTKTNMVAEAEYIRNQSLAQGNFPGYQQIQLQSHEFRGRPGAFWKFYWMDNGIKVEALDLMYIAETSAGPQSYALYFTAPASQWTAMHSFFNEEAETFAPLPS